MDPKELDRWRQGASAAEAAITAARRSRDWEPLDVLASALGIGDDPEDRGAWEAICEELCRPGSPSNCWTLQSAIVTSPRAEWLEQIEHLSINDLERITREALDDNRRRSADDQSVFEAWQQADRDLIEAAAKARAHHLEHLRSQMAAALAHERLAFLIDRLGFIPGGAPGLEQP